MIEIDESWEQSIIQEQENKDEIDTSNLNIKLEKKNNNSNIEQICCIELTNNNYIYIQYEIEWTIRKVRI